MTTATLGRIGGRVSGRDNTLDAIDNRILRALQTDCKIQNVDLADIAGLSPSACLRRVKRLESAGILHRYVALANAGEIGLNTTVFVRVSLSRQDDAALKKFERSIALWPEVLECYLMTGDCDYQLRVLTDTLETFERFLRERLTSAPGVANIQSSFALKPIIYRTELPLD